MRIIGLMGYARSGKDTAAKALIERGWTRIAFADAVREMALAIDPVVDWEMGERLSDWVKQMGWEGAKQNPEIRRLLQAIGTEGGRKVLGENVWIDAALRKVSAAAMQGGDVVLTDVRFFNEAQAIRDWGGMVVQVNRPGVGPLNGHASESLNFAPDCTLDNSGTVEQLHAAILALAECVPA